MQELTECEIDEVSGAAIPLALYAFYAAGGTAGVAAGWQFGKAFFCNK